MSPQQVLAYEYVEDAVEKRRPFRAEHLRLVGDKPES